MRELGPGGRILLVLAGLVLAWAGLGRAGLLPSGVPHLLSPPAPELRSAEGDRPAVAPGSDRPAWRRGPFPPADAPARCDGALAVAVPAGREFSPGPGLSLDPVSTAADALARLGRGEAPAALVTLSELAAGWSLAAPASPRLVALLAARPDVRVIASDRIESTGLETVRIAAVPGSAEEYRALALLAGADVERASLVPATSAEDALARLDRGEVDAAALPQALAGKAAGAVHALEAPGAADPLVLVVAAGTCTPTIAPVAAGTDPLALPEAWAAAVRIRETVGAPEPLALLDRRLLGALVAADAPAPGGDELPVPEPGATGTAPAAGRPATPGDPAAGERAR